MNRFNEVANNPLKSRKDMQEAVNQICNPLAPFYSDGKARLHIGNTGTYCIESTARMEAFARPLWGLVPHAAGGGESELWRIYLEGIRNGTNPEHEEYWGIIADKDQLMVEMAVLGFALSMIPEKVWYPLNEGEKKNLADWLLQINHYVVVDSNWLFFRVLVNLGLKKVGEAYNREMMEKDLNRLDEFYLSDGWYQDGISEQRDYYIPFAMHFYGLIYAKLMEKEDKQRSIRYKERAVTFAKDFIYWFSSDGTSVPFGRSLTYRFAQSGFWGALAFADVEAVPWGVIKGIVLRNLRWWFKQPIFSTDGILTIGYAFPNLHMAEGYNAPGSPYWALKTFLPLALPEDHPFWMAEELELPELETKSVQQHPHMILCRQEEGRHVLAYTAGQHAAFEPVHCAAKYEKFVYSNVFGFSVPRGDFGLEQGAYDSMLALSEGDQLYRVRRKCEAYAVEENYIYSKWKPWKDVEVQTWVVPVMPWHVRIHLVKTNRTLDTAEGGFAIAKEKEMTVPGGSDIILEGHSIAARFPWGTSGIVDLAGERRPEIIRAEPNTNLMAPRTYIPTLKGRLEPGAHVMACAVLGEGSGQSESNAWNKPPRVIIEKDEIRVEDFGNEILIAIKCS
ncbi:MAG: DUF2264 domain-containing protein [Clostridia bacterium]|nr:DUF2264 domain-containing protein [Clostridia bacterium]